MLIILDFIIIAVLIVVAFWQICLICAQVVGSPSVYANKNAIIDACKLAGLKKGQTLIDLGCGDGRSLILAAREFGAKGIGIERSPYCYLKSRLNVLLSGQKNIKILFGNFLKFDQEIKKTDVVYIYLLNSELAKIEKWFFSSIGSSTKVVSLAFEFPNHKPDKIAGTTNLWRRTKLRLYTKS